ncbi:unnamed protein product, partial [Porites evermanni]
MRSWFILAFSLLLTANATNGTKSTDGKSFVCNQYNGHNSKTNQAIKKIDKKLDQIIEMLQPSLMTTSTCKGIYTKNLSSENKAYLLDVGSAKIPVYCHMTKHGLDACGGGGWTLVMKIDGTKTTFHYTSQLWSNKVDSVNLLGGKAGLDTHETKLPTYWNTLSWNEDRSAVQVCYHQPSSQIPVFTDRRWQIPSYFTGPKLMEDLIGSRASLYSPTVTRKDSTYYAPMPPALKQELVSLPTIRMSVALVTPESGLALEGTMMTPTRVVTKLNTGERMATSTSKRCDTSWF